MGEDAVSVRIKRQTALELLNALAIALGVSPQPDKKGKKKKKDGGGKKYKGPQKEGKLEGKSGGKPKPHGKS